VSHRIRATALAGLLAGLMALLLAAPADAAVKGRIVSVQAKQGTLQVVFSAAGLAQDQVIDPESVELLIDGEQVDATVEGSAATAGTSVVRRAVLAIDTSGSMNVSNRIGAARQAALAYLAKVPADVEVGLVTFSDRASTRVPPTKDRAPVRAAVQALTASGDTALYDAVRQSVALLGPEGDRSILVLSDGKDEGSSTTLAADVAALRTAKIPLSAVLLGDTGAQAALRTLSDAAGGRVVAARAAADRTAVFEQPAVTSEKDVVVTAKIPDRFTGGEAQVTVRATAAGQAVTDSALAVNLVSSSAGDRDPSAFGPRAVEPVSGPLSHKAVMYAGLLALFLGVGGLLAFALVGTAATTESMSGRLQPFVDSGSARRSRKEQKSMRETAVGFADDLVRSRGLEETLAARLDAGGVPLKPSEWLILHLGIAIVLPLFVLLISNVNIPLTLVAVLLGILGPLGYLSVKATLRTRKFLSQLPDTLQLLAGSLSAGYSLPQAVDAVVRQGSPPMSEELHKALVEARLGAPIEDALEDVADRMGSKDFRWVVMAIRIQRQVGGNLAEVLSTTAATLRERERLRRQVQVLSAEGRLSAYVLFGLPIFFALYLMTTRAEYLKPLITDPIGWILLALMGILLAVGAFWLRKVVDVEV
jgi:tight adherence protein B